MLARTRAVLVGSLVVAYAVLAHHLTARPDASVWALLAMLGPMAGVILVGLWRSGQRWALVACLAGAGWLVVQVLQGGRIAPQWLYLAQHAGIHAALGLLFGRTLLPGRKALISAMAERVHRVVTPDMAAYTRRLTAIWTGYFALMTGLSLGLFLAAPLTAWSLFANLLTPIALGLLFVGEHVLRYWLHPEFERISLGTVLRAYADHQRGQPSRPVAVGQTVTAPAPVSDART